MKKVIKIDASNKQEALSLGGKILAEEIGKKVDRNNLSISILKEKKGFLGFGSKKTYQIIYEEKLSKKDEDFLEMAVDNINIDGEFKIKITENGVFLKVSPPEGQGKAVNIVEVKLKLDEKEIIEIDWQFVREIINNAEGKWEKIASRKPELDRDADVQIEISEDKLRAFLTYIPPFGGKKIDLAELKTIISEKGVNYGVKENILKEIIKAEKKVESFVFAEGDEPIPGKDAGLEFHFKRDISSVGTKREDGSMDFRTLGLITNVREGEVLVSKIPAEPGLPGKGVTGEELIPPTPKDVTLPRGKNTEIKDDEILVAKTAGQVVLDERKKVQVLPIYEVSGDVDLSTGNIEFIGNVIIKGNVTEGFKVKADGNVEIKGNVSVADIEAGGDVIIHHGFVGKNKSQINAKGDVRVKFVENGIIKSAKNIFISDASMHSKLIAGESIQVIEKKGLLVGGIARARTKIEANIIGSNLATITTLEAGVDPELKNKIKELEEENSKIGTNLVKTKKAIKILEQLKEKVGTLPGDKLLMYSQLDKTRKQLEKTLSDNQEELKDIQAKLDISEKGYIQVRKRVYPGVKITIANVQVNIHNEQTGCKFVEQDGEITQLSIGW